MIGLFVRPQTQRERNVVRFFSSRLRRGALRDDTKNGFVADYPSQYSLQLFRERLSEKVHAAIPKGIVGGFECTVSQRNLKEWHERAGTNVCECY